MATPSVGPYRVGDSLSLECVADSIVSTNTTLIYMWSCSGCFADGNTTSTITQQLTDMDSSMISCSISDGIDTYLSDPFNLQVTGTY